MRDVLAGALPSWDEGVPGYGFVLGCYAFALEETGDYAAAERAGREAVECNSSDIWAAHAVAHVFEMTGRPHEGVAWVDSLQSNWAGCNNFAFHASGIAASSLSSSALSIGCSTCMTARCGRN